MIIVYDGSYMKTNHHAANRHVTLLNSFLHLTLYIYVVLYDLRTRVFSTNVQKTSLKTERFSYVKAHSQLYVLRTAPHTVPTFHLHKVFMCIVWFLQPKPTVSQTFTEWCLYTSRTSFCTLRKEFLRIIYINFNTQGRTMARRFVAGLSRRRLGFDPRSVHVRLMVDIVALGQVFLRVLRYSPVTIILPIFHIHLHAALTERKNGRSLGTSQKRNALSEIGKDCIRRQFHVFSLQGVSPWVSNPRTADRMCKLYVYIL